MNYKNETYSLIYGTYIPSGTQSSKRDKEEEEEEVEEEEEEEFCSQTKTPSTRKKFYKHFELHKKK